MNRSQMVRTNGPSEPQDVGRPPSRRWILTPICLSVFLHVAVFTSIQNGGWLTGSPLDGGLAEMFTIETTTVSPEDLVRITAIPDVPPEIITTRSDAPELPALPVPVGREDAPPRTEAGKPFPRYPEEELPIVARSGLSERSQALVRDGELNAVDPGDTRIAYIPPGRTLDRVAPTLRIQPELRDSPETLANGFGRGEPGFLARRPQPVPSLDPPPEMGTLLRPEPGDIGRGAEGLFIDEGGPVALKPLDLDVKIDVYAEADSEFRYFRMTISERPGAALPVIPKDVLFVVDISASIRVDMLRSIQEALKGAAAGLNPADRFNVVRFSEDWYREFDEFVPPTPENISQAARSVRKEPGQVRTDVYAALKDVIAGLAPGRRPTNIILISDGNPTSGVQDIRHIVSDLSAVTTPNQSIFTVNPGARTANAYLLDLLTYRHRGRFVQAPSPKATPDVIRELLVEQKDPVLVHLRAQYGNFEVDDVYPQPLPNLYAGRPIVIHGRCRPGEVIAVRVIGDSVGERRKFLHTATLPEMQTDDQSIAREWARGKMHFVASLIAREGERPEYMDEMERLSERYGLASPFE